MSSDSKLKNIVEAALLAAGRPLSLDALLALFPDDGRPDRAAVRAVFDALADDYAERGLNVREVGTGWRIEVRSEYAPWVSRLWEEKPPRYSRALMETLALMAYRQPITRGEIEEIRGVSVGTNIVKTLLEREWVRVVGHRDVPGKPALYATTRAFLEYFGLKSLEELPSLGEIKDLDSLNEEFRFATDGAGPGEDAAEATVIPLRAGVAETPVDAGDDAAELTESTGEAEISPEDPSPANPEQAPEASERTDDDANEEQYERPEPGIVPDVTH